MALLSAWHLSSYFTTDSFGSPVQHIGALIAVFAMALASLFFRDSGHEITQYLESIVEPIRPQLIGAACLVIAGMHSISIPSESVFLKMGYIVLVLAFFEAASLANRFLPALRGDAPEVTKATMKRLLLNQAGMLIMVFALSAVLLYMSLMTVVGFYETWSVALLAAMMMMALAFMTMIRRL